MTFDDRSVEGMTLGGYRILGLLGRGAMADVFEAEDSTGHTVALKVFRACGGMSFTMIERFRREAEATKKLRRHPYILTVYATGHEGDYHYIAMERVEESRTLESLIRKGASQEVFLSIGVKIAAALQYAHEHHVIHRDVKPGNILLDEFQEPMLADFGVAELTDWPSLTLSGALTGTPMYMAPEQARGEEVTPAADVYSLAVVLYEALTGASPYDLPETPSTSAILDAVKHQSPAPPRKRNPKISRDLNYVLLRGLRKNPGERYASAREFSHDLENILEGRPVTARWVSPWTNAGHWIHRNRTPISGGMALLLFAGAATGAVRERLRESDDRELIQIAKKTNSDMRHAALSETNRAEPEMRLARRAMNAGNWLRARDLWQTAVETNLRHGLTDPIPGAQLELARTEVMLHNSIRAIELYRAVWSREDAGAALRQIAAFEGGMLLLLDGHRSQAEALLERMREIQAGPYEQLLAVAVGEPPPTEWANARTQWQPRLRWNAILAETVRQRGTADRAALVRALDEIDRDGEAESPNAWPLPFASYLKGRL